MALLYAPVSLTSPSAPFLLSFPIPPPLRAWFGSLPCALDFPPHFPSRFWLAFLHDARLKDLGGHFLAGLWMFSRRFLWIRSAQRWPCERGPFAAPDVTPRNFTVSLRVPYLQVAPFHDKSTQPRSTTYGRQESKRQRQG